MVEEYHPGVADGVCSVREEVKSFQHSVHGGRQGRFGKHSRAGQFPSDFNAHIEQGML